jgi:hypothetical protein
VALVQKDHARLWFGDRAEGAALGGRGSESEMTAKQSAVLSLFSAVLGEQMQESQSRHQPPEAGLGIGR